MIELKKQHGAISWNELMTSDLEGAKTFYGAMFNWTFNLHASDENYPMASIDGEDVAGLMPTPKEAEGMPPTWGAYVTVDDTDQSAKQAVELGGKVLLPPQDIPEVGRFCVISDPQGATLNLISYFSKD